MNNDPTPGGSVNKEHLKLLLEQFQAASGATATSRAARGQLLDELQEAVGLSSKMSTENDILSRAQKLLRES